MSCREDDEAHFTVFSHPRKLLVGKGFLASLDAQVAAVAGGKGACEPPLPMTSPVSLDEASGVTSANQESSEEKKGCGSDGGMAEVSCNGGREEEEGGGREDCVKSRTGEADGGAADGAAAGKWFSEIKPHHWRTGLHGRAARL